MRMMILTNKEFSKLREENPDTDYCVLQTDRSFTTILPCIYTHEYTDDFSSQYIYMVLSREEVERVVSKCDKMLEYQKDFGNTMMKCNLSLTN